MTKSVSKDVEFYSASFELYEKFVGVCPPMRTPTQKFKNGFSIFDSHGISSGLISFEIIFEALQSELFSFKKVTNITMPLTSLSPLAKKYRTIGF